MSPLKQGRPRKHKGPCRKIGLRLPESVIARLDAIPGNRTDALKLLLARWDHTGGLDGCCAPAEGSVG